MRKMLTPRKRDSVDHGTMLNVRLRLELGINRQQVVGAVHRNAVRGMEEQRDLGALRSLAEVAQPIRHPG